MVQSDDSRIKMKWKWLQKKKEEKRQDSECKQAITSRTTVEELESGSKMEKKNRRNEEELVGGYRYRQGENDGSTCRSVEIGSTIPDRKRARLHGRWSDRIDENCNGPAAVKRSNFAREQRAHTTTRSQVGPIETRFQPRIWRLIQVNGCAWGLWIQWRL